MYAFPIFGQKRAEVRASSVPDSGGEFQTRLFQRGRHICPEFTDAPVTLSPALGSLCELSNCPDVRSTQESCPGGLGPFRGTGVPLGQGSSYLKQRPRHPEGCACLLPAPALGALLSLDPQFATPCEKDTCFLSSGRKVG